MKNFKGSMSMSEAVRRMVDDSGLPLKAIAAETGKGYTTLYRELDSEDDGAKIGVDTLPLLIRACCGDAPQEPPLPLVVLAARLASGSSLTMCNRIKTMSAMSVWMMDRPWLLSIEPSGRGRPIPTLSSKWLRSWPRRLPRHQLRMLPNGKDKIGSCNEHQTA